MHRSGLSSASAERKASCAAAGWAAAAGGRLGAGWGARAGRPGSAGPGALPPGCCSPPRTLEAWGGARQQGRSRDAGLQLFAALLTSLALAGHMICWSVRPASRASCSTGEGVGMPLLPRPLGLPGWDTTAAICGGSARGLPVVCDLRRAGPASGMQRGHGAPPAGGCAPAPHLKGRIGLPRRGQEVPEHARGDLRARARVKQGAICEPPAPLRWPGTSGVPRKTTRCLAAAADAAQRTACARWKRQACTPGLKEKPGAAARCASSSRCMCSPWLRAAMRDRMCGVWPSLCCVLGQRLRRAGTGGAK
jgi:hypothetical protein